MPDLNFGEWFAILCALFALAGLLGLSWAPPVEGPLDRDGRADQ